MEMFEKSINTLELPAVLEMLANAAVSEPAQERARALRPSADVYEIRSRLGETSAAVDMMVTKGSPSFSAVKDVRSALARADIGGMLNTRELLDIANVLRTSRSLIDYINTNKLFDTSQLLSDEKEPCKAVCTACEQGYKRLHTHSENRTSDILPSGAWKSCHDFAKYTSQDL